MGQELSTKLGQEVGVSSWLLITQQRVNEFAEATGDHQFIHTDSEKAANSPFGTTIAHGFLTLSLLAGELAIHESLPQLASAKMVVNYGLNKVRFIAPVKVGSRIRNHAVLQEVVQRTGYLQLALGNTVEIENENKPALIAEILLRVYF